VLGPVHNAKKTANISRFLLGKIGLDGKRVRENTDNETRDLSFRNLSNLCVVSESDIQKKGSPIETGQVISRTVEYSVFKLLLTGVDDSALVSTSRVAAASQSRAAKLEVIDELIASCQQKIAESGEDQRKLASQLERLAASIAREQEALRASEEQYQALLARRNLLRQKLENGSDRRGEIDELLARFDLLDRHYKSDLARLESIREAGSLLAALSPQTCPLCGASPTEQHRENNCDGNLETVVAAVEAESAKIVRLRRELAETVEQLGREAASFERLLPRLTEEREKLEREIVQSRPGLAERRTAYTELVEERASVHGSLTLFAQLADLQTRRTALERTPVGEAVAGQSATDLSSSTLDQFARHVETLLKAWNFPESDRAHFEETDRDLVIQGKRRSSQGKGKRAITHAAFTIGLMNFCKAQSRQHPGFVVLDSPLLAYRAPEGPEDDLRGTDVQDKFYEYLAAATERQVLVVENTTPPEAIARRPSTTFFSKNPHQDRYGFFPLPPGEPTTPTP
jgi:predicted nuclease with TOPRIM domain